MPAKLTRVANPPRLMAARNTLSVKFGLLVGAIFAVALTTMLLVQRTQRQSLADLLESEKRERSGMMSRVVELMGQSLRDFTYDYAQWDDMMRFVETPQRAWAAINLDATLDNFNLAAVWVLRPDGTLVYATRGEKPGPPPALPLDAAALRAVLAKGAQGTFFVRHAEGLFELCVSPVHPSDDAQRSATPRGWLVAARAWDAAQLTLLGKVVQAEEVTIAPPGTPLEAGKSNQLRLHHPLPGLDGVAAAHLICVLASHELEIVSRHQRIVFGLFAAIFALTAVLAVYGVFRWVVRPLEAIGESLQSRDAGRMAPLLKRGDEIGRVAQQVKTSFEQRAALEEMIEGRIRLGRELHDGVIQTVFAAGMNLAGARAALRGNPAEAERILDDTRTELNATIRGLRDFICGLEPEPVQERTFCEAVRSIVTLMQGVRPVASVVEVDNALANTLSGHQRLHLLQIAREAVSNSVRHGCAGEIRIQLRRDGADAVMEITDDGIGLERAPMMEGGRGLANLAARAQEMGGNLEMTSRPAGGLRVRLAIPLGAAAR